MNRPDREICVSIAEYIICHPSDSLSDRRRAKTFVQHGSDDIDVSWRGSGLKKSKQDLRMTSRCKGVASKIAVPFPNGLYGSTCCLRVGSEDGGISKNNAP